MHLSTAVLGFFISLLSLGLWAQTKPMFVVESIGLKEGLPTADIHALYRDQHGFLWIGTDIGLVQYDGFVFKPIHTADDGQQLGLVNALLEDAEGYLWVATEDGLFMVWRGIAYRVGSLQNGVFVRMNTLLFDQQQHLWCGTANGAYYISQADQQRIKTNPSAIIHPTILPGFDRMVPVVAHRRVFSLGLDEKGQVYIGGKYDLFRYQVGQPLERIWRAPKGQKTEIWSLAVRSSSDIVFSAHDMFCYIRLRNGKEEKLLTGISPSDVLWNGREFWLLSYGLKRLAPPDSQPSELLNLYETTSGDFTKLLIDREGIFWVATNEGLLKIRRSQFERIPLPDAVAGAEINGFGIYNGQFVFGAHHGRVFSLTGNTIRQSLGDLAPIAGVSGIQQDQRNVLWLATTYQGLIAFDGHTTKKYSLADGLGDAGLNDIILTQQNGLWAVGDGGITHIQYDSLSRKYKLHFFEHNTNRYRFTIFYSGIEAPDQTLWLASDVGLLLFRGGRFQNQPLSVQGGRVRAVRSITQDKTGRVWLATDGQGLLMGRVTRNTFRLLRQYTTQDGMASNTLMAVLADSAGNIWTGSANGLNCLTNVGIAAERIRTFNYSDGFFDESYQQLRLFEYPAGTLWIGTTAGLMRFPINQLATTATSGHMLITDVQLRDGQPASSQLATGQHPQTGLSEQLELDPAQNALTFSYILTSLGNAPFNRYRFRLDGADAGWRFAFANDRTVTYSGLSPGSYTFRVEGVAANGVRSKPAQFAFVILPPFWQRGWFIGTMVLLLGSGIWGYIRWRENQFKQQEAEKSRVAQLIAELETRAIRSQMNPHFIFNCLNAIQECILADDTDTAYRYLSKFSRLLRLVLEESTKSFHSLQQELDILQLYLSLEALRFGDTFSYDIHTQPNLDAHFYQVPALLLQPLVENAVRHGLLHKAGQRKLSLRISQLASDDLICIIEDNGIGRQHAAELARRTTKYMYQTSKGILLTQERLVLLEKAGFGQATLRFDDLTDAKGQPTGTRVTIQLPLITQSSERHVPRLSD